MDDSPRRILADLIAKDATLLADPPRLEGYLRDYCGEFRREVNLLVRAFEVDLPRQLASRRDAPVEVIVELGRKQLEDICGLSVESARWAAESWALALGHGVAQTPDKTPLAPPRITFTASLMTVSPGITTTLGWITQNATAASIAPGVGTVPVNGSKVVSPASTTTYTLTATGPGGTSAANVTVTVGASGGSSSKGMGVVLAGVLVLGALLLGGYYVARAPEIESFTCLPCGVESGKPATLSWTVRGASKVFLLEFASNGPAAKSEFNGSSTRREVKPAATTRYFLEATNMLGRKASKDLTVNAVKIVRFSVDKGLFGSSTPKVFWSVEGATDITIYRNGIVAASTQPAVGSLVAFGLAMTTYKIVATGPQGASATQSAFYFPPTGLTGSGSSLSGLDSLFRPPATIQPKIEYFKANKIVSYAGEDVLLQWKLIGNKGASVSPGLPKITYDHGEITMRPTTSTTYTLTMTGSDSKTYTATVAVLVLPKPGTSKPFTKK